MGSDNIFVAVRKSSYLDTQEGDQLNLLLRPNVTSICFFASMTIFLAFPCSYSNGQTTTNLDTSTSGMAPLLERFATDRAAIQRSYATPMSPLRAGKMKQFFAEWQNALEQVDFAALQQDGRIDYLLFKNLLQYELRQLAQQDERLAEVSEYLPGWQSIVDLEERRRNMEGIDAKQSRELGGMLTEITAQVEKTTDRLKKTGESEGRNFKKTHARRAVGMVGDLRNTLKRWSSFYSGYDPVFTWWVGEPYEQLDQALEDYAAFWAKRSSAWRMTITPARSLATRLAARRCWSSLLMR